MGPGGTGKTSVLKAAEALIDHFNGQESVRKCAISNTAARLLKGDTMHAMCKLPRQDLQQNLGRLTSKVLKEHRAKWRSACSMFVDEVSMVSPDQLLQTDQRTRQAKQEPLHKFGNLMTVLSGDFLQLPPVNKMP